VHCAKLVVNITLSELSSEADPCRTEPCKNNGNCTKVTGTEYECTCAEGWTGTDCTEGIRFARTFCIIHNVLEFCGGVILDLI
jgi:hypothetical protein